MFETAIIRANSLSGKEIDREGESMTEVARLLLLRVEMAKGFTDYDHIEAIRKTIRADCDSITVSKGQRTITFRRYSLHYTQLSIRKVLDKSLIQHKKSLVPRDVLHTVRETTVEMLRLWEIEDIQHHEPLPDLYLYTDPTAAKRDFDHLLLEQQRRLDSDRKHAIDDRPLDDEPLAYHYAVMQEGADRGQYDRHRDFEHAPERRSERLLACAAIMHRSGLSSQATLKDIAQHIYIAGEQNISRIAQATGLARDTVYKALRQGRTVSPLVPEDSQPAIHRGSRRDLSNGPAGNANDIPPLGLDH